MSQCKVALAPRNVPRARRNKCLWMTTDRTRRGSRRLPGKLPSGRWGTGMRRERARAWKGRWAGGWGTFTWNAAGSPSPLGRGADVPRCSRRLSAAQTPRGDAGTRAGSGARCGDAGTVSGARRPGRRGRRRRVGLWAAGTAAPHRTESVESPLGANAFQRRKEGRRVSGYRPDLEFPKLCFTDQSGQRGGEK